MNTMNVNGQNGAATSAVKYVDNFSNDLVWVYNRDNRTRGGSFNWQIDAVKMIVDYFTFAYTDTDSLKVSVYVYGDQICVKAEFNGKDYRCEKIITAKTGKKEIKRILGNMGVVEDVIKRETEKMMKQMMEQEDNTIDLTEKDVINEVVEVINANLIDDATEGQKLDWTLFSDSTMEYLFANGGPELYEKIKNGVKSRRIVEVLAYDDCFYVWYDEDVAKNDAPCLDDDMELAIERLADDIANRADSTMGDYFVDVTRKMWNANDTIDEDRLRELLFDKVDGVADIDFAEPDDEDDIVRIWFNRPIKNDAPCLDDGENVRDYFEKNNDERAFFVLPDYDYVCGLFVEYNEDDDVYVAMGNDSWNETEYDGDTDMSVVIADFSNAWAKEIDDYCDGYKDLDYDMKIYRNDDYDGYMILLNSGVDHGLNVEEGYDPYKGDYVEVIA